MNNLISSVKDYHGTDLPVDIIREELKSTVALKFFERLLTSHETLYQRWQDERGKRISFQDRAVDAERSIQCEYMDPCGTIWDYAETLVKEVAELRQQLKGCEKDN